MSKSLSKLLLMTETQMEIRKLEVENADEGERRPYLELGGRSLYLKILNCSSLTYLLWDSALGLGFPFLDLKSLTGYCGT